MSYEVTILGLAEKPENDFQERPDITMGIIEVKPPISAGTRFGAVILGTDQHGVSINEVGSAANVTILLAESGSAGLDQAAREKQINEIALRVEAFANNPSAAMELLQQSPFPEPPESW